MKEDTWSLIDHQSFFMKKKTFLFFIYERESSFHKSIMSWKYYTQRMNLIYLSSQDPYIPAQWAMRDEMFILWSCDWWGGAAHSPCPGSPESSLQHSVWSQFKVQCFWIHLGSKTKQAIVLPHDSWTAGNVVFYSEAEMGK